MKTIRRQHGYFALLTFLFVVFSLSISPNIAIARPSWAEEEQNFQAREKEIALQQQKHEQKYGAGKDAKYFAEELQKIAADRARMNAEKQLASENKILLDKVADYLKSRGFKVDLQAREENRVIGIKFSKEGNDFDIQSGELHSTTFRHTVSATGDFDSAYKYEQEKRSQQETNKFKKGAENSCGEAGCWMRASQSINLLQELPLPTAKAFFAGEEKSYQTEFYSRGFKAKTGKWSFGDESSFHFRLTFGALYMNIYYKTNHSWTDDTCCSGHNNVSSADKVFRLSENKYPGSGFGIALAKFIDAAMKKDNSGNAAAQTKLVIEPTVLEVKPDGLQQVAINFYAAGKSNESASLAPVATADIKAEILPDQGKVLGNLSAKEVITGTDGKARIIYTAPAKELWQLNKPDRIEIKVKSEKLGITDSVYVSFPRENKINILARHAILPAHRDFANDLTISFEDAHKDWGKKYKALARCASKDGRIVFNGNELTEVPLELISGASNSISYRWAGEQPSEKAVEETIEVTIPDLGLQGKINFSVGIDLIIDAALTDTKGTLHPNLFIPFKVYIRDKFHPDADLGLLFKDFGISPQLAIEQISYTPIAAGSPFGERFLQNFIGSIEGAVLPHGHHVRDIPLGSGNTMKDQDGRWLLVNRDAEPADRYPGVIPYDMGNYLFRIKLLPGWKGDAGLALQDISLQLTVDDIKPEEEMFLTFLLPTMQAYITLYPGVDAFALTAKISALVYEGKYKTAARELAQELILSKIGEKGGAILNEEFVKIMEKKLPRATYEKLAAKLKTFTDKDGADFLIDQLNLDILGTLAGSLVDGLEEATIGRLFNDAENVGKPTGKKQEAPKAFGSVSYIQEIMGGSKEYGLILLPRKGVTAVEAAGTDGRAFREAPATILTGGNPAERIHKKEKVYVLPFRDKEMLTMSVAGDGSAPVRILKITPEGVSSKDYSQQGEWKKKLTVK